MRYYTLYCRNLRDGSEDLLLSAEYSAVIRLFHKLRPMAEASLGYLIVIRDGFGNQVDASL